MERIELGLVLLRELGNDLGALRVLKTLVEVTDHGALPFGVGLHPPGLQRADLRLAHDLVGHVDRRLSGRPLTIRGERRGTPQGLAGDSQLLSHINPGQVVSRVLQEEGNYLAALARGQRPVLAFGLADAEIGHDGDDPEPLELRIALRRSPEGALAGKRVGSHAGDG